MAWVAVGAIGGALIGGIASNSAANKQADAITTASQGAQLQGWQYNGPGGMGANTGGQQYNPQQFSNFANLANIAGGGQGQQQQQGGVAPYGSAPYGVGNPMTVGVNGQPAQSMGNSANGAPFGPLGGPLQAGSNSPGGVAPNGGASPTASGGYLLGGYQGGGQQYGGLGGIYGQQGFSGLRGGNGDRGPMAGYGGYNGQQQSGPSNSANQLNTNLGNYLNPAFGGLGALAAGQVGQAGMASQGGIPANIQQALMGLQGNMQGPQGTQGGLYGQLGGMAGMQMGQGMLAGQGFNQIMGANGNYNSAYNNALQAQMGFLNNQQGHAMQQNSDAQFQRGQMGTSGGALQTQAMAQGFGLADAQAQQYAASQGLAAQGQALGQGNAMLGNAFGNYNNSANLSNNMYNNIYTQNSSQNQIGYDRSLQNVGTQTNAAMLPQQLAGNDLNLALQAMQGASGLNNMGLQNAQAALGGSAAQANAAVRAGTAMGGIATSPQFSTSGQNWGNAFSGLINNQAVQSGIQGLFSSGGSAPVNANTQQLAGISPLQSTVNAQPSSLDSLASIGG